MTGCVCACTHYLVFKEPAVGTLRKRAAIPQPCTFRHECRPSLGEPSKVTRHPQPCQPPMSPRVTAEALRNGTLELNAALDLPGRICEPNVL